MSLAKETDLRVDWPLTDQCLHIFPKIWLGRRDSTFSLGVSPENKCQTWELLVVVSPAIYGQSSRRICAKKDKKKKSRHTGELERELWLLFLYQFPLFEDSYMIVNGVHVTPNPYNIPSHTWAQLFLSFIELISVTYQKWVLRKPQLKQSKSPIKLLLL